MYCKFCGNRITLNTIRCESCGANIDFNDGGQSFFDDNELDVWCSDGMINKTPTLMPSAETKLLPKTGDFENIEKFDFNQHGNTKEKRLYVPVKNKILDFFNLSNANRLIIFCIASVVAIVLLIVAIIAAVHGTKTDETVLPENTPGYTYQTDDANSKNDSDKKQTSEPSKDSESKKESTKKSKKKTEEKNDKTDEKKDENTADTVNGKTIIKDIKILDKDGKEISHSVPAYIDENNFLYISLDKVLKHEGYKDGKENGNNPERIVYEHKSNGKIIEIEKETSKIWINKSNEKAKTQWLDADSFEANGDIYVPARSFLEKYGYDSDKVKWEQDSKTLYFVK